MNTVLHRIFSGLLAAALLLTQAAAVAQVPVLVSNADTLRFYAGEVKVLRIADVERVAIGNGEVISATNLANELVLIGTQTGYTNLLIWTKKGQMQAYNIDVGGPHPLNVDMRPMVYLTVQVVDFRKSVLERIGIDWQQAAAGPVLGVVADAVTNPYFRIGDTQQGGSQNNTFRGPNGSLNGLPASNITGGYIGVTTSISSIINLAVQNGDAYILASPQLSTRSGGNADFLAGGEVPIPIVSALGQVTVQYKEYGIKLKIKPEADQSNNILASIDTEVSQIDPSVTVDSYPGFLTRKTSSSVNVRSNETVVLSGLMQSSGAESISKVPGLGSIPILGRLFSSKDFQANRSELVIFVTPVVVFPGSNINQEAIERGTQRMKDFNNGVGERVYTPGFGAGPGSHLAPKGAAPAQVEAMQQKAEPTPPPVQPAAPVLYQADVPLVAPQPVPLPPVSAAPAPPMLEAPVPVAAPVAVVAQAAVETAMAAGLAAVQIEPAAAAPVVPARQVEPVAMNTEKMWTVQACSSAQSRDAERCHALIEKAGFTAAIRQLQGHEKSRYRVQLGPYVSQAEAVKTRNALQAKGYRSAYWFSHREPLQSVVAEPESRTPAAVNEPAAASESVALDIPA